MRDYSSWTEKQVQVTNLLLDPMNPRIPSGGANLGQRELIAELVAHDKVYELAKDIAEQGYVPLESLIGVADNGKTYIVEGNRRLAALKLLISPDLAPPTAVKKFRTLAAKVDPESIRKVRVLFAPSRDATAPLILQKHTRDQVQRWSPLMQARFFRALAAGGLTAEELAKQYDRTPAEVSEFLRIDKMYEAACAMDLPEDVRPVVHNPRAFNASTLQRMIAVPETREFLGIDFDNRGELVGNVAVADFRAAFTRILTDMVRGVIDTRVLNKTADIKKYLASIASVAPKSKRGRFTSADLKKEAPREDVPSEVEAPRAKPARLSRTIIPSGMKCRVANPRIREVFDEVRRLKVNKFPNTCAAMLRILLELAMGHYLDQTGKMDALLEREHKKGKPKTWYPSWKEMLTVMLQDDDVEVKPLAAKRLNKLVNDRDYSAIDGYVHNRFVTANPRELHDLAAALQGIFEVVLQEPLPKTKPAVRAAK